MSTLEDKARKFATKAHEGQKRKYTNENYVVHPAEVAGIVESVGGDEEMIAAAWLHDVVEDCGVLPETVLATFGTRVASLVADLTDISKLSDGNRKVRKAIDREHTAQASPDAKTIKLADLISNTSTIVRYDPDFAKVYLKEKEALLEVLTEGNPVLFERAFAARRCRRRRRSRYNAAIPRGQPSSD